MNVPKIPLSKFETGGRKSFARKHSQMQLAYSDFSGVRFVIGLSVRSKLLNRPQIIAVGRVELANCRRFMRNLASVIVLLLMRFSRCLVVQDQLLEVSQQTAAAISVRPSKLAHHRSEAHG